MSVAKKNLRRFSPSLHAFFHIKKKGNSPPLCRRTHSSHQQSEPSAAKKKRTTGRRPSVNYPKEETDDDDIHLLREKAHAQDSIPPRKKEHRKLSSLSLSAGALNAKCLFSPSPRLCARPGVKEESVGAVQHGLLLLVSQSDAQYKPAPMSLPLYICVPLHLCAWDSPAGRASVPGEKLRRAWTTCARDSLLAWPSRRARR